MSIPSVGRVAVITGSNPPVADLTPEAVRDVVEIDGIEVPFHDDGETIVIYRHHHPSGHRPAHLVDHAANLAAIVSLGCTQVLALSSTGSLSAVRGIGTVLAPDDLFAPWVTPSIHDDARGHSVPGFAGPWRARVVAAWQAACVSVIVDGGVYAQMTGPRFETPAEIRFLATVADVVGMTVASECILAAELGLDYAAVCIVDNLANGLAAAQLTTEEFHAGVEANRAQFAADVRAVLDALRVTA